MFAQYSFYRVVEKFPIQQIKRKKLRNAVNMDDVFYMLMNFEKEAWTPVTLDHDYFLIDGQHRIELAKQMGLEYIDVVIQLCKL
ncbi:MAG: ParB N-terminal domain-containing protein [Candidatus Jacksonbacteria bacterium]|nr:ParB N-terminal domain-containing protein [Candidatus Jacksonbacteria bacterium]